MRRYNPKVIEPKWQKIWEDSKIYSPDLNSQKPKYIGFGMFNYPSGAGIHIGHARNYTIPDVITRVKRQQGFEAYQPVGWDSFGLPAENFAIKTGVSPQESTKKAIEKYRKQYKAMGWAVDWSKEINTTDPEYYKWTQWTFLKLFENDLAYQKESSQWWCPHDKTVLADEQVEAGRCWRCGHTVERKNLKQWFFKITDYADEILDATNALDWTEAVKASQKAWIGKSLGALIKFQISNTKDQIEVFTTRPDTLFGATYMVLAPEHPLVSKLTVDSQKSVVGNYVKQASRKSELERQEGQKDKTGVFSGSYAVNPANQEKIPIWIADYVLMGYGTGAIMAVPAHDERDYEFAQKFDLPIKTVIAQDFGEQRSDETYVEGPVIVGYDKKNDKYLSLRNDNGSVWIVGGGREKEETFLAAAGRELIEETGYQASKMIELGDPVFSHYYNEKKDSNRRSFAQAYLALIDGSKTGKSSRESHEDFEAEWLNYQSLVTEVEKTGGGVEHWLEMLRRAKLLVESGAESYQERYTGEGVLINSGKYDGLNTSQAREKITAEFGKEQVNYRLRDWLISRQRYWGAPIPIIHCSGCGPVAVPEKDLPVLLPSIKDYEPTGGNVSVLAGVSDWVNVDCPSCGKKAKRETDTMDGYVCSSWYFLRYLSPNDESQAWDSKLTTKWMPIDFYNGADHATAHLLYARFFTRFFHKLGLVSTPEPFKKMVYNGKVKAADGSAFSKSKGNGVDPLEIINSGYGADALRLYEMFAAPVELDVLWDPQGVPGMHRFLSRIWVLTQEFLAAKSPGNDIQSVEVLRAAQKTAKKVTEHIEAGKFNTAISFMMELVNELYKIMAEEGISNSDGWQKGLETLVQLVAPFAPHIAEEMWADLGNITSVHVANWPTWDEVLIKDEMMTLVVQINGKLRGEILVEAGISESDAIQAAKSQDRVAEILKDKKILKTVYVPGRLISFVVNQ